jgi:polyferredoxin
MGASSQIHGFPVGRTGIGGGDRGLNGREGRQVNVFAKQRQVSQIGLHGAVCGAPLRGSGDRGQKGWATGQQLIEPAQLAEELLRTGGRRKHRRTEGGVGIKHPLGRERAPNGAGTLLGMVFAQVQKDGPALKQSQGLAIGQAEAAVHQGGDLAKGIDGQKRRLLLFTGGQVNLDHAVGKIFFFEVPAHQGSAAAGSAVKREGHGGANDCAPIIRAQNHSSRDSAMASEGDGSEPRTSADSLRRLAPYLQTRIRRGVVGSSRYAQSLRRAIREAAEDPRRGPVLISGEPGLEKDNLAALIHFSSPARRHLMVRLNCALLRPDGAELFHGDRHHRPLLACLGEGALLLDQFDRADPALRPLLLQLVRTGSWANPEQAAPERFAGRLFLTAETSQDLGAEVRAIRVPPLRVRRADLGEWLRYAVRQRSRSLGWSQPPRLNEALIKQLQSYDFPGNVRELFNLVDRALRQCARTHPAVLPDDVFWTDQRRNRPRFDLWRWKPWLRDGMRAPALWNGLLFGLVSWLFVLVNLWLWLGPQDRAHNGALNLFWAWWWPLILLTYPLVGRLWCSFCPFMVWGEISQRLARALGHEPKRWPRGESDRWASPLLAAGFAAILLWEAVADLPNTAWLSSCLLLLITAGAVVGSWLYEKRFWCRYLCPVGGMNGLFAKLAISELRAQAGTCSGSCSSYACFKGGPAEGEGLASEGCPLGTHPAHLEDNRNCVLCLTCAQACPHRSVQLRLRPPAADLQREMAPPEGEVGLILVLAGGVCLHHWQRLLGQLPLAPASLVSGPLLQRLAWGTAALALPAALFLCIGALVGWFRRRPVGSLRSPRLKLALYALLPLLWGLMLADHLPLGLEEAGRFLPVSLAPWQPAGADQLPFWQADHHVVAFCQTAVVLLGLAGTVVLLRRLLLPLRWSWLGWSCLALALSGVGRWLVARPA